MVYRFVFQVRVKPRLDEPFILAWRNSSLAIQHMSGARGTRLHRKLGEDGVYIAIAEWDSKSARDAAFALLRKASNPHGEEMRRWPQDKEFGEWTLIGHLEEIEAVYPPTDVS